MSAITEAIAKHKAAWKKFGDEIDMAGQIESTPAMDRAGRAEERAFIELLATPAKGDDARRKLAYVLREFRQDNFDTDARHLRALIKAGAAS